MFTIIHPAESIDGEIVKICGLQKVIFSMIVQNFSWDRMWIFNQMDEGVG